LEELPLRLVIAGSRYFRNLDFVEQHVTQYIRDLYALGIHITEIVGGRAPGVDELGEEYARINGLQFKGFPADWYSFGRAAGPIRNREMADYGDFLIAFPRSDSKGTKNMITNGIKYCHDVRVVQV
jgi:hypothetical protein